MDLGIIYKFEIISEFRFYGRFPFYIGQHWGKIDGYWGSGKIWNDFLRKLKLKYPTYWKKLVKREILWQGECNQKTLDKLEEVYIRREHAHYSEKLGGCNVLWGTANNFGSGSPMKDDSCKKKQAKSLKDFYERCGHPMKGKKFSDESKKKMSESHKGKKLSNHVIEKIKYKNLGKKRSREFSEKMKEIWKQRKESGWVSPNKGRKVSKDISERRAIGVREYYSNHQSSFKGKHHSEESKKRISEKMKEFRTGFKCSEETKQKMSESAKLAWKNKKEK